MKHASRVKAMSLLATAGHAAGAGLMAEAAECTSRARELTEAEVEHHRAAERKRERRAARRAREAARGGW